MLLQFHLYYPVSASAGRECAHCAGSSNNILGINLLGLNLPSRPPRASGGGGSSLRARSTGSRHARIELLEQGIARVAGLIGAQVVVQRGGEVRLVVGFVTDFISYGSYGKEQAERGRERTPAD